MFEKIVVWIWTKYGMVIIVVVTKEYYIYTGTRYMVERLQYHNQLGHLYPLHVQFDTFLTRNTRKMHEIYMISCLSYSICLSVLTGRAVQFCFMCAYLMPDEHPISCLFEQN